MTSPWLRRTCLTAVAALALAAGDARAESGTPVASGMGESPTPAPATAPSAPARREHTYTFQVVLLAADNATPAVVENVPAKAQKALKDLQDFLPYKSYHLVDMAWLRTDEEATSMVTGPKGESYVIDLRMRPGRGPGERILMDFSITQVAMMPPPGASAGSAPAPRVVGRLLSSTFGMELGETVVVGTAKLDNPGRALIVLLSALP